MESTHQNDPRIIEIQGLLNRYLAARETQFSGVVLEPAHLDEDSLSAFVDGAMPEREAAPAVRHLTDCSFCRGVTAELIRLDAEMAGNEAITTQPSVAEPSRASDVLSGILGRLFGSGEPAVFAHGEDEPEKNKNNTEISNDEAG